MKIQSSSTTLQNIALIPKTDKPGSYDEFRSISLCHCVYKIISKVIAVRLKGVLSGVISPEQFGFLQNRHIQNIGRK